MKGLLLLLWSFFLLNSQLYCVAQVKLGTDSVGLSASEKSESYGLVGMSYTNDWVYMGRKDSLQTPYLAPYFEYSHASGLFFNTSLSYLTTEGSNRFDLFALTLGYDYSNWKLSAGAAVSGYLYDDESYNVQSAMTLYSSAYFRYDFYFMEAQVSAGIGLSDGADGFASAHLLRSFYPFVGLEIRPSSTMRWGTQRYYNEYYQNSSSSHGAVRGKGKMGSGGNGQTTTFAVEEVSKFRLLDYEFSLLIAQKIGRFRLFVDGTYAAPLNPAQVTIDELVFEEDLGNTLFWSTGISYILFGN